MSGQTFQGTKTSKTHKFILNPINEIIFKRSNQIQWFIKVEHILYMKKHYKIIQRNNKFKRSSPTWNNESELLDGSNHITVYVTTYLDT